MAFTSAQGAGDLIVVGMSWGSSASVSSITDTKGNTYTLAVGPTSFSGAASAVYYAKNIAAAAAGANTVTVTFNTSTGTPDLRVAEYSGIDTTSPLDVTAVSTGTSATSSSGSATTTNANDLLIGSNAVLSGTAGAGTGFTQRQISTQDGNILEDQIVSATGAYSATAPLTSSAAWIMQMAAFKAAAPGGDTTPPSAPTGLNFSGTTASQTTLNWTASTDNVGVTGYRVERCAGGVGCSTFTQIGTPTATTFTDTGLAAGTSYTYRVRATDGAGNLSAYSSPATTTTSANPITYVQSNSVSPNSTVSTISVPFTAAQVAGHFIVVATSWGSAVSISSVSDTKGNTYSLAVGPTTFSGAASAIYYAKNIAAAAAGANTVTVTYSAATGTPDLRVAEYAGVDTTSPLDVTAVSTGTSATSSSGSATTTNPNELLVGANAVLSGTQGAGTGFTKRQISTLDGNILEDQIVSATGAYTATAPLTSSAAWIMQMAAFKASGGGDTTPPGQTVGLNATATSASQINLSWTAGTDNVGVTGYRVERCAGSGCTSFVQVGTPTTNSFNDTGLSASTLYRYQVRATDAAGNLGAYSSPPAGATTFASSGDTTPPTAPTVAVLASSSTEIDITWSGATDNIGVTGYIVERCTGTGCSSFVAQGSPTTSPFYSTGLTPNTTYIFRMRALDAAGNASPNSNLLTVTTPVASPDCD
ncbi:MAG: fibronectin type III domain-containing protein [Proteobacteria bacterium]|nr:fibronectin type III domain-containing protein [Pseudomonadota bacterium]